jgi:hypothetical protein
MQRALKIGTICGALTWFAILPAFSGSATQLADWSTVTSARYGFKIAYPGNVFTTVGGKISEDGQVLVSHDGKAKLVIGAFANESELTMQEYREQILDQNYKNARLDFSPMRGNFFVISGTVGDRHFYERVSFTCGGRLINSWAMLYTNDTRDIYDRVIDAMARTYAPGRGDAGGC